MHYSHTVMLITLFGSLYAEIGPNPTATSEATIKRMSITFDADMDSDLQKRFLSHRYIDLAEGSGPDGSDAIRVSYEGYEKGSQRIVMRIPLGFTAEAATLSFNVKFDQNFQWVRGGKLHGLGPINAIAGGRERQPDGWSARIMFQDDGACQTYLYDQSPNKIYGLGEVTQEPVFTKNQWYHVTLAVRLNTPDEYDGSARILIDYKEILHTKNICFRGVGGPETMIQRLLFSTFHGGSTPDWAPVDENGNPTTVHAYFDNFVITEGIHLPPAE